MPYELVWLIGMANKEGLCKRFVAFVVCIKRLEAVLSPICHIEGCLENPGSLSLIIAILIFTNVGPCAPPCLRRTTHVSSFMILQYMVLLILQPIRC